MKKMFFILILMLSTEATFAQSSKDILLQSIKEGDIEKLSDFLEEEVYLVIPDNKGNYKKNKATSILQTFFNSKAPNDFIFKHEGNSKNSTIYLIGQLQTSKSSYRTYLLYKEESGIIKISELRIETEE